MILDASPVGPIGADSTEAGITALHWGKAGDVRGPLAQMLADQLNDYFAGQRHEFDLPFAPQVSDFQRQFHAALCAIPYGETRTYGDLAADLGVSAQAIGQACGANPIPILIPCHRVLGADGLGGYSGLGGVETKVTLLRLEGAAGLLI